MHPFLSISRIVMAASLAVVFDRPDARADFLTDWNNLELDQIRTTSMDPLFASRDLAILQVSMSDAINGVSRVYNSFYVDQDAPSGTSMGATMAAVGYQVMTSLYGSNSNFTALYNSQLASLSDSPSAISQGINWGVSVSNIITTYRANDGSAGSNTPYTPTGVQGDWAPTPPNFETQPLRPGWSNVTPFALNSSAQFRPNGPPTLDAAVYAADFNQVKSLGQDSSATRTLDQTNAATFWRDPQGTVTTAGHWNQALQTLTSSLSLNDRAKVYAAVNVAMADAAIATWDAKYAYNSWRPVTAIRDEALRDTGVDFDNPDITGNANWNPLFDSPLSPSYVSLTSAQSQAAARILASLLGGDAQPFSLGADINGDGVNDMTRSFASFSAAANEAGQAGIYGGYEFGSSVQDGSVMGDTIGQFVNANFMSPVPEPSGLLCLFATALLTVLRRGRWMRGAMDRA
jgi:hypothetical protein